jgi:hypothetical protein
MAQIFISYNHRSLDAVKTLAKDLEAAGNYVWFDQALAGGHRWWDDILAGAVLILLDQAMFTHANS